jgi:hypothetical protein
VAERWIRRPNTLLPNFANLTEALLELCRLAKRGEGATRGFRDKLMATDPVARQIILDIADGKIRRPPGRPKWEFTEKVFIHQEVVPYFIDIEKEKGSKYPVDTGLKAASKWLKEVGDDYTVEQLRDARRRGKKKKKKKGGANAS